MLKDDSQLMNREKQIVNRFTSKKRLSFGLAERFRNESMPLTSYYPSGRENIKKFHLDIPTTIHEHRLSIRIGCNDHLLSLVHPSSGSPASHSSHTATRCDTRSIHPSPKDIQGHFPPKGAYK